MPTQPNSSPVPRRSARLTWPSVTRRNPDADTAGADQAPAGPRRRSVAPAHERRDGLAAAAAARPSDDAAGDTATSAGGPAQAEASATENDHRGLAFGRVRLRSGFSITSRSGADGRERHLITAPKRGPERRRARETILSVFRRAERQGHRVAVVLTLGDYTQLRIGPPVGYDPAVALLQCSGQGDDPFEWCVREHLRQRAELVRADTIIGVELATWPSEQAGSRRS